MALPTQRPSPDLGEVLEIDTVEKDSVVRRDDVVAVEEPLEIRIVAESEGERRSMNLAISMRTPGADHELAAGFLLAEGIVETGADIWRIAHCDQPEAGDAKNVVEVHLKPGRQVDPERFRRNVYTSSSCGVCGKESIEALRRLGGRTPTADVIIESEVVCRMPETLVSAQDGFASTGGLHACGVFSQDGELRCAREDVGRHNAMDKAVGRLVLDGEIPASTAVVLVSGRASFELVHKAMAAGVGVLLAVGAPSSLAVETARAFGMTLIGFVKRDGFNIYCGRERVAGL